MPKILDYPSGTPEAGDQSLFHDVSAGQVKRYDPSNSGFSITDYLLLTLTGVDFSAKTDLTVNWDNVEDESGAFVGASTGTQIAIPADGRYIITLSCGAVGKLVSAWVEVNNVRVAGAAQFNDYSPSGARGTSVSGHPLALTTTDVIEGHFKYTGIGAGNIGGPTTNWISLYRISD